MTRWEITSRVRRAERNFAKGDDCMSHGLITDTYDLESFVRYCGRFVEYLPVGWRIGHDFQEVIVRVLFTPRVRNAYVMVIYDPTRMRSSLHN